MTSVKGTMYSQHDQVGIPNLDLLTFLFESESCIGNGDSPIYAEARDPKLCITKSEVRELTEAFAFFLRENYQIGTNGPGKDVVTTVSSGQRALPCLFFGVVAAGGVYSAAATTSTKKDLARQIEESSSRVVVCSQDVKDLAVDAAESIGLTKRNVLILTSHAHIELQSADGELVCDFKGMLPWIRVADPNELRVSKVCIVYSSGTTGLPKGVVLSHTNLIAEALLVSANCRVIFDREREKDANFQCRALAHLPSAHASAILGYFVYGLFEGAIVYWMPKFNFEDFVLYCDKLQITEIFSVPTIFAAIAKHPAVKDQFRHLLAASCGAAPMTAELQQAVRAKMAPGALLMQTWGMSETTASVTFTDPRNPIIWGSVGTLLPNMSLRLVDDDGNDVPEGEAGEALLKGPVVFQGYHNNPRASEDVFTKDGWLRTGDVIQMKDNELFMIARKKELIKFESIQVPPAELEAILVSHEAVIDCAVIGVPQDETEVPRAYVVLASPAKGKISEADLVDYVGSRVSDHKRLRGGVSFIDTVPRMAAGKILRKDLRRMWEQEVGEQRV